MGALIAFNVARHLDAMGAPLPSELFLSAHRAPHLPDRDPMHELSDEEFLARLGDARLAALDPELREIFLSIVRADITLCETYRYEPAAALPCPITVFGGRTDELVDVSELYAWAAHTSNTFDVRTFPGGHFYQRGSEQVLADHIRRKLRGGN
jgi:medium-chain acyl-[acyl-carrier-protein] hydrolase